MPRKNKEPPKHPAVDYLERIGGGLTFVSLVSLYPYPQFYWWGVVFFYAGFTSMAAAVLLERWPMRNRLAVCALWVCIAAVISLKVIFVGAPLEIAPLAQIGNHPDGADVSGIKWEKGMSELRILLSNHTAHDYDDLDISFTPNVPTRKVAQVSKVPDLSLTLIEKVGDVDVMSTEGGTELYASGSGFRMRCSKLPKDTTVELLVALIMPAASGAWAGDGKGHIITLSGDSNQFAGPKRLPTTLYVKGQYAVLNRPHVIELTYGVR